MASVVGWITAFYVAMCCVAFSLAVVELDTDEDGKPIWLQGEYRNRNEVPVPENYDAKRKHRDISPEDEANEEKLEKKDKDGATAGNEKKGLIRTHFMMPFGVQMPLQYSEQTFHLNGRKGKKSKVPENYKRSKASTGKMNLANSKEYYVPLNIVGHRSRSHVPSTWGMAWKNSSPIPETPVDSPGEMRSILRGGLKLKEEDIDDGLMFRGLGGQGIRAQNEALIEGKFDEKMADEEEERGNARRI